MPIPRRSPEQTRRRVWDAAFALFSRQGVESVSMDAIAEAAGVAKGTLYLHAPSRDALIQAWRESQGVAASRALPDLLTNEESRCARVRAILGAVASSTELAPEQARHVVERLTTRPAEGFVVMDRHDSPPRPLRVALLAALGPISTETRHVAAAIEGVVILTVAEWLISMSGPGSLESMMLDRANLIIDRLD